jgi:hypothetical protein
MSFENRGAGAFSLTGDERFNREIALAIRGAAVNQDSFVPGHLSAKELADDRSSVQQVRNSPDYVAGQSSEATALEYGIIHLIREAGAFGDAVKEVRKASEFDDVRNGIDFYIIFEESDGTPVLLGGDATTSNNLDVVVKKLRRTNTMLDHGQMPKVKYFEGIDHDERAVNVPMPRVVIGFDKERTKEFQKKLLEEPQAVAEGVETGMLLEQMIRQLKYAIDRIRVTPPGEARQSMLAVHERVRATLQAIKKEKGLPQKLLEQAMRTDVLSNPQLGA